MVEGSTPLREPQKVAHEGLRLTREPQKVAHEGLRLTHEPQKVAHESLRLTHEPQTVAREGLRLAHEPQTVAREGLTPAPKNQTRSPIPIVIIHALPHQRQPGLAIRLGSTREDGHPPLRTRPDALAQALWRAGWGDRKVCRLLWGRFASPAVGPATLVWR